MNEWKRKNIYWLHFEMILNKNDQLGTWKQIQYGKIITVHIWNIFKQLAI